MAESDPVLVEDVSDELISSVSYDDETVLWRGGPSQWVNLGVFLWWGAFLVVTSFLFAFWNSDHTRYDPKVATLVYWGLYGLIVISTCSIIYAYLYVRFEHTVITRNKIKESKGITSIFRRELFCEISDIKDVRSPPAGLLGLLGLSSLVIETNDDDQPIIRIRAIRNRDELINQLLPVWRKLKMERKGYFGDR